MNRFRLNRSLGVEKKDNGLLILAGDSDPIKYLGNTHFIINLLFLISQGKNEVETLHKSLFEEEFVIEKDELISLISKFFNQNIIKPDNLFYKTTLSDKDRLKYDRQIKAFSCFKGEDDESSLKTQERIKKLSLGIIGVDGVGSYFSYGAAAIGFKK